MSRVQSLNWKCRAAIPWIPRRSRYAHVSGWRAVFLLLPGEISLAKGSVGGKAGQRNASFISLLHSWETGYFSALLILFFPSFSLGFQVKASWFPLGQILTLSNLGQLSCLLMDPSGPNTWSLEWWRVMGEEHSDGGF